MHTENGENSYASEHMCHIKYSFSSIAFVPIFTNLSLPFFKSENYYIQTILHLCMKIHCHSAFSLLIYYSERSLGCQFRSCYNQHKDHNIVAIYWQLFDSGLAIAEFYQWMITSLAKHFMKI